MSDKFSKDILDEIAAENAIKAIEDEKELRHFIKGEQRESLLDLAAYKINVLKQASPSPQSSPARGEEVSKDRFSDLGLRDGMASPAQLRMIEGMWMDVSSMPNRAAKEKALKGFLKRITGVEELRFLEDWQVQKLIKALEHMKPRPR